MPDARGGGTGRRRRFDVPRPVVEGWRVDRPRSGSRGPCSGRARCATELLLERAHFGGELDAQLLGQQRCVLGGQLHGVRGIPGGGLCLHQEDHRPRVERVEGQEPMQPSHRFRRVALGFGVVRQGLEDGLEPAIQALGLRIPPVFEVARVLQVEPVEEGAPVQGDGPGEVAPLHRVLEVDEVHPDPGEVQPKRRGTPLDGILPERLAKAIDGVGEGMARGLRRGLRPQVGGQLVATGSVPAGRGQHGQQAELPSLGGAAGHRAVGALEGDAAEQSECEHALNRAVWSHERRSGDRPTIPAPAA